MSAIIYSIQLERVRRELANYFNIPLNKTEIVPNKKAIRLHLVEFGVYEDTTVLIADNDNLIFTDGLLTDEEVDEALEEINSNDYYDNIDYDEEFYRVTPSE